MSPELLSQALDLLHAAGLAVEKDGRWYLHPNARRLDGDELDRVLEKVSSGRMTLEDLAAYVCPSGLSN